MDFDGSIIYIIFAIGYFIFKIFFGGEKKQQPMKKTVAPPPQQPTGPVAKSPSSPANEPTLEDVFETLFNKPKTTLAPPPKPQAKPVQRFTQPAKTQQVKQQIKHQSHSIGNKKWREPLVPLEVVEFDDADNESSNTTSFNVDSIDWQNAIISREILERKFA